jgi:hypothetical protein
VRDGDISSDLDDSSFENNSNNSSKIDRTYPLEERNNSD